MGLDMYLHASLYLHDSDWASDDEKNKCRKLRKVIPEMYKSENLNSIYLKFEVAYWRKANEIHAWFVDNVQDGVDECDETWVSRDDLRKLVETCKKVLSACVMEDGSTCVGYKSNETDTGLIPIIEDCKVIVDPEVAEDLLPTRQGFFFGSIDYDEWYVNDLQNTIKQIEKALELPEEWEFYYHSSW